MHNYLKSKSIANWSVGLLKVSPFLAKFQDKNKSFSLFYSAIAALSKNLDYSSGGEEEQSFIPPQKIFLLSSIQVCNNLHNLRTNPSVAFAYFKDCENLGFTHGISSYTAIISILFHSNQKQNLSSLFSNLICSLNTNQISSIFFSLPNGLVSFSLDALLKAYETCKRDPREAANVFFHLGKLGFIPSVNSCNFLLNFVAHSGNVETLFSVFDHMIRFGINPEAYSFTIPMEFFLNAKQPSEAIQILEAMVREGMRVSSIDYNKVIYGLCKESRLEEAEKLLEAMSKQGVPPDHYAYAYLIEGYCEKGNLRKASDIYEEMISRGIKTTPHIAAHFLKSLLKRGMNKEVLVHLMKFKEEGVVLDKVLYNIAMEAYCRLGFMKEAVEVIREMRINGLDPDKIHYTCLIAGFIHWGDVGNAHKVFVEMLMWGLKPDTVTYNVLLRGFRNNGLIGKALIFLAQMIVRGIEFDVNTYGFVIEVFCKGGRVYEAELVFKLLEGDEMGQTGRTRIFSSMVSGYLSRGLVEQAYGLFLHFSQKGYLIEKSSYEWLIRELCNKDQVELARNVFCVMFREHQVVPDKLSYGKLITAFCHKGDMCGARFWYKDMLSRGIRADLFIYTALMDGYCKVGRFDDAREVFEEMTQRKGIKPDVVAYNVLLDGNYKQIFNTCWSETAEIKNNASNLIQRMVKDKIEADVVWYTVLIAWQCKMGDLNRAQKLFDEMLREGLRPDVEAYTALINGHCTRGEIEKAQGLFQKMVDSEIEPDQLAWSILDKGKFRARKIKKGNTDYCICF